MTFSALWCTTVFANDRCPTEICWPRSFSCSVGGAGFSFHTLKTAQLPNGALKLTGNETYEDLKNYAVSVRAFTRKERYLITYTYQSRLNFHSDEIYVQRFDYSKKVPLGPWERITSQYPFDPPREEILNSIVKGRFIYTTDAIRIVNLGFQSACISIRRAPLIRPFTGFFPLPRAMFSDREAEGEGTLEDLSPQNIDPKLINPKLPPPPTP